MRSENSKSIISRVQCNRLRKADFYLFSLTRFTVLCFIFEMCAHCVHITYTYMFIFLLCEYRNNGISNKQFSFIQFRFNPILYTQKHARTHNLYVQKKKREMSQNKKSAHRQLNEMIAIRRERNNHNNGTQIICWTCA